MKSLLSRLEPKSGFKKLFKKQKQSKDSSFQLKSFDEPELKNSDSESSGGRPPVLRTITSRISLRDIHFESTELDLSSTSQFSQYNRSPRPKFCFEIDNLSDEDDTSFEEDDGDEEEEEGLPSEASEWEDSSSRATTATPQTPAIIVINGGTTEPNAVIEFRNQQMNMMYKRLPQIPSYSPAVVHHHHHRPCIATAAATTPPLIAASRSVAQRGKPFFLYPSLSLSPLK